MTLDRSILRSLRSDPDLDLEPEDGVIVDSDATFANEMAAEDDNFERDGEIWRGVGQAHNIAIGADPFGWTPQGIESVGARMNEWEFACWRGEIARDPTARQLELDRLIAEGNEDEIAAFRERCAVADEAGRKAGSAR